jgi:hypothetical protein
MPTVVMAVVAAVVAMPVVQTPMVGMLAAPMEATAVELLLTAL